ncbi:hypothetical protein PTSG_07888 [Salpingoeca rosetta]|uniref:tRNA pseudouridine synthase n=1 Tax=Salpingoeca rosetta (strain ATCC 50818 / BSB-021) TaxID=946362 RepID=F2UGL9_SALR5|nr:uncharacterized protein PTSG_07888 [Salpingoeca rosetta]EGD75769.1 hypothetical protein PTSG_07888 [Salpingoeca rosetta]|eukprot:XP_004991690.1 hypothetical protein PTSG_07888 [Salpingoeca rosetta]
MEWIRIQVKGQSFMLHQIRKMIGMAVAVARGFAVMEDVYSTFNHESVDVPRIPGLGLYLDSVFFDFYNKKFQQSHPPLSWEEWDEEIEAFKADQIVSEILRQEKKHEIIKQWLSNLYHHKYEARCRHAGNSPLPAPATQDGDNDEDEDDDDDENGDGDEQRGEQEEGTSRASA